MNSCDVLAAVAAKQDGDEAVAVKARAMTSARMMTICNMLGLPPLLTASNPCR